MPEISRFFGISIKMFYGDHMPPHFHAWYGEHKGVVDIQALVMIGGYLPPRALGMVIEWAMQLGQISLGGYRYSVGRSHTCQDVHVTFDAEAAEFVVEDSHQEEIKRLTPKGLTAKEITGLEPTQESGVSG